MATEATNTPNDGKQQESKELIVSCTLQEFNRLKKIEEDVLNYDGALEIREACRAVTGGNSTFIEDDLNLMRVLAKRAILCGLHLDIKSKEALRNIEEAKKNYPNHVVEYVERQGLLKEPSQ